MDSRFKVVHYLNQFFGQIGGEDQAHMPPLKKPEPVGPGRLFQALFSQRAEIKGTVICGDNFFNQNQKTAAESVFEMIASFNPDLVLAGPAFNAGRYGVACGAVCQMVTERLGIPAITGMFHENPGADLYKKSLYIIETRASTIGMKDAALRMIQLAIKLKTGDLLELPEEEGYIPRGIRKNRFTVKTGAARGVEMLLQKLKGNSFTTECPMPVFDHVKPLPPIKQLSDITLALITSGGIVPKGNPDRLESSNASSYGKYDIGGIERLTSATHESVHGGYDPAHANADPHRVLPLDVVRDLERSP